MKKEEKKIDAVVKELQQVLRSHHLPLISAIKVMIKFSEPLQLLRCAIQLEELKN